jgi:hypothetical protein
MKPSSAVAGAFADLHALQGRVVLVKSTRDRRNPPTGMRGWIEVVDSGGARPVVRIAVEFPQMFTQPAHHRTFVLDEARLAQLLASERNGTFEFTIDDELS